MDQQSSAKQNFFLKSPEISFAVESPSFSFLKDWNKNFLGGGDNLNLSKKLSNSSIPKISPCISSLKPTPRYDPLRYMGLGGSGLLQDSKLFKSVKIDFLPIGSPEINFVLGPSAIEFQTKRTEGTLQSIFDKHTKVAPEDKIAIKHIQAGGPTIYVSNKRVNRILKRRKKRVAFLLENPEFSLPYKFRTKGPRHQSRSKSAKNRKRKGDGRFAKTGAPLIDFTVNIDDTEFSHRSGEEGIDDIIRTKI